MDVSTVDLHVAFSPLRMCGSYCKLVHLARATPPSHCADYLKLFDEEVRLFFTCIAVDVPDPNWQQAQLSQSFGGLGFRSLAVHCSAAFIASLASHPLLLPKRHHLLPLYQVTNLSITSNIIHYIDFYHTLSHYHYYYYHNL